MNKKNLRRILAAFAVFGAFTFAPIFYQLPITSIAEAEFRIYNGVGEDYPCLMENLEISRRRAVDKAVKSAVEQAVIDFGDYSRARNFNLTENELSTIVNNAYQIVSEPKCEKINEFTPNVFWRVTVDINVDDLEIVRWLRLDTNESSKILNQTQEIINAAERNNYKIENLRKRHAVENDSDTLKAEFEQADAEFLSNINFAEGTRLYYRQQYDDAVKALQVALKFNSNNKDAWQALGEIYTVAIKDKNKAAECYNKAVEIDSDYIKAWKKLGLLYYYDFDDKNKSRECYGRAAQIGENIIAENPNDVETLIILGQIYKEMSLVNMADGNKAAEYFYRAADLAPENKEIWLRLAAFYIYPSKNYAKVVENYERVLEIEPNDIYALNSLAVHYTYYAKDYERAIEYAKRALEIDPYYSNACVSLGHAYKAIQSYGKAIENYKRATELAPDTSYNWYFLADLYKDIKDYQGAVECYEQALNVAPKDDFMWYQLGYLYGNEMKNYSRAIECYTRAIEINPRNEHYYTLRAYCYEAVGDKGRAENDRVYAAAVKN